MINSKNMDSKHIKVDKKLSNWKIDQKKKKLTHLGFWMFLTMTLCSAPPAFFHCVSHILGCFVIKSVDDFSILCSLGYIDCLWFKRVIAMMYNDMFLCGKVG